MLGPGQALAQQTVQTQVHINSPRQRDNGPDVPQLVAEVKTTEDDLRHPCCTTCRHCNFMTDTN